MLVEQERWSQGVTVRRQALVYGAFLLLSFAACGKNEPVASTATTTTLRLGVAEIDLAQFAQNLTVEALVKIAEDGRVKPWLAQKLTVSPDARSLVIQILPNLKFHDGTPVSSDIVAAALRAGLAKNRTGSVFDDLASIEPLSEDRIEIKLRDGAIHPAVVPGPGSPFILEALETSIRKPGPAQNIGTGPFLVTDSETNTVLRANPDYFLGRPTIDEIVISGYPGTRAAWADLLRDRLDMLYDVGLDALDSLESATTVDVFSYVRHYQYLVILNTRNATFRSPEIRRALNSAIDRPALIRDGLFGHGLVSNGPIWPKHWALQADAPGIPFDPAGAADVFQHAPGGVRFTCLVVSEYERIALALKRQLQSVGVNMTVEAATRLQLRSRVEAGAFDAMLVDAVSGPSIFRPYLWWHSNAPTNFGKFASAAVDDALDTVRHAGSDEDYRAGVVRFQEAILHDPPAIFLAWIERARAVSERFVVEGAEPEVDMIGTLRLWRPAGREALSQKH